MGRRQTGRGQHKNSSNYEKPEHLYMFMSWSKDLALNMGWMHHDQRRTCTDLDQISWPKAMQSTDMSPQLMI